MISNTRIVSTCIQYLFKRIQHVDGNRIKIACTHNERIAYETISWNKINCFRPYIVHTLTKICRRFMHCLFVSWNNVFIKCNIHVIINSELELGKYAGVPVQLFYFFFFVPQLLFSFETGK